MRYLLIGFILSFSLITNAQDESVEWQTDVVQAVNLSIKEGKPLCLFFTGSDWCGWCRRLQGEVFTKPKFQKWAEENVILVELDFPKKKKLDPKIQQQNMEIAQMFGIQYYPTIWFVTPTIDGQQISFNKIGSTGYVAGGPDVWIKEADKILGSRK